MSAPGNYYTGGLAEIVTSPSKTTYSFLKKWFTGGGSIGRAMEILGMPYQKTDLPVLVLKGRDLVVDLENEEKTLYQKTIFKYKKQRDINATPKLAVDFIKLISPICLLNTLRIISLQSKWIANPKGVIETAEELVRGIPDDAVFSSEDEIDRFLQSKVWPIVVATGLLCEFFSQLLESEAKEEISEINNYIGSQMAEKDWFFRSTADQIKVKQGKLSFSSFIDKYGLRADKDYELTCPRWYEIKDEIKKRIGESKDLPVKKEITLSQNDKIKYLTEVSISLQLLRSEAKRKALTYIDKLRKSLKEIKTENRSLAKPGGGKLTSRSGKGTGVSRGNAGGIVKNINDNFMNIPLHTIGVFPNAGTEFTTQYPKCAGLIFLRGGQTSHGAIVAREFGIPAIIDSKAEGIKDNVRVEINGLTGEWKIV